MSMSVNMTAMPDDRIAAFFISGSPRELDAILLGVPAVPLSGRIVFI
jgi:hypothetical protein